MKRTKMSNSQINKAFEEASLQKDELVCKLGSFVMCDSLLFVSKETPDDWRERIEKAVAEANAVFKTSFVITDKLEVPCSNLEQKKAFLRYFETCCDDKAAYIYLVATELRSVLAAVLAVERKISLAEAFELAFYEEICQQKKWGLTEEAESRQREIKNKLQELERAGYERGLFKD